MSDRKLAAILSADAVGYSRLMAEDEAATVRTLTDYREEIGLLVRQHRGRVVDAPGDNLLAEFPTATDAVSCAVEIQGVLAVRNAALSPERRMEFRIGVHLGEVRAEGERIYGDGVNIAARLEGLAEPGGICISRTVHEQVRARLPLGFEDLGEQSVKNIPEPVRVYRVRRPDGEAASRRPQPASKRARVLRSALIATGAVLLVIGVGLWATWPRPLGLLVDWYGLGGPPVNPRLPPMPSLVVLPFTNMSGDPDQEYFADGITEDLTADLSGLPTLFVISRSSAFTYKGEPVKVEDVGRELGVRYVLEGSVRRAQGRVRITAQLIDATTGFHLWSERYDRELEDIFALQAEISEAILAALHVEVVEAEIERIRSKPTGNLSAYDAFMRGLFHFDRGTRQDHAEARRWLERAIELDPEFALAYALLAGTYNWEYRAGWNLDPSLLDRAEELVRRAAELDASHPGVLMADAWTNLLQDRLRESVLAAERAVALAPNWDRPHWTLASAFASQGQLLAAARELKQALRLNPRPPPLYLMGLGWVNVWAGRTREAVELWERVRASNPDDIGSRVALASHYQEHGRHAEARTVVDEIRRVNPELTAQQAAWFAFGRVGPEYAAEVEERLRRAGLPEAAPAAATDFTVPGFGGAPAIAVLPFDNLSGDPDQEYFADGLAENLITQLSGRRSFPVIARNSSFVYKGKAVDVKRVSHELGARYLVEGSVQRADDRVRIAAQLIDGSTGAHLWAETYERQLVDIFAIQDEIAGAIVNSINPALTGSEMMRAMRETPADLDAFEHAMRGWWHCFRALVRVSREDNGKAREYFQKAIELAPSGHPHTALAYAGLALSHYADILHQWTDSPARSIDAQFRAARRCAEVDRRLWFCQERLAWAYSLTGEVDQAIAAAELAIELNPSSAQAHFQLGLFRALSGRPDDGIEHINRAIRLSPRDPALSYFEHCIALAHFAAGRYEETVRWEERSLRGNPDYWVALGTLAAAHAQLDRTAEARAALRDMLRRNPEFSPEAFEMIFSFADRAFIERYLDGLRKAGLEE